MSATEDHGTPRGRVLKDASALTHGDRNDAYGDPVDNHEHIARIFNAITGRDLSAREIVLVHEATKLARRARNPRHYDSYVDNAAYVGIEFECALAEFDAQTKAEPQTHAREAETEDDGFVTIDPASTIANGID